MVSGFSERLARFGLDIRGAAAPAEAQAVESLAHAILHKRLHEFTEEEILHGCPLCEQPKGVIRAW